MYNTLGLRVHMCVFVYMYMYVGSPFLIMIMKAFYRVFPFSNYLMLHNRVIHVYTTMIFMLFVTLMKKTEYFYNIVTWQNLYVCKLYQYF